MPSSRQLFSSGPLTSLRSSRPRFAPLRATEKILRNDGITPAGYIPFIINKELTHVVKNDSQT